MTRKAVFHDAGSFDDGSPIAVFPGAVASVFGRTGTVAAVAGDYFGAMPAALTGATQAARFVGATTSGAPVSGTFAVGDVVVARDGKVWVCTVLGSPGTWVDVGGGASVSYATPSIVLGSSAAAGAASTVIRSDSTIAAFDATSPSTQAFGDSAVVGTAAFAARRDHKHAMPAAPAAAAGIDGWVSSAVSLTYSSVDGATGVVTTGSSLVGVVPVGARVKFDQTTTKYFIVTAVDATTLTFWGGTDYTLVNAAITNFSYSLAKVPVGFNPDPAKWTVSVTNTSNNSQSSPTNGTWYNPGSISISVPIGCWDLSYEAAIGANRTSTGNAAVKATMSTANNSESDTSMSMIVLVIVSVNTGDITQVFPIISVHKGRTLTVATKTSYFLNVSPTTTGLSSVDIRGDVSPATIRAICAYL